MLGDQLAVANARIVPERGVGEESEGRCEVDPALRPGDSAGREQGNPEKMGSIGAIVALPQ